MKFLSLLVLVVAVFAEKKLPGKRGAEGETPQYSAQDYTAENTGAAYAKVQQYLQKSAPVAAPQPQYYAQPAAYSLPQQLQYQPQSLAYSQPAAAAAQPVQKIEAYRQPYSLANDVSTFTYSSPFVTYNNLGLLSQVIGRGATAAAKAAPAPTAYQAPRVSYSQAAPAAYAAPAQVQPRLTLSSVPQSVQQYLSQSSQQAYLAQPQSQAQAYLSQSQPQAQAYLAQSQPQAQAYLAQSQPQAQAYLAQSQPQAQGYLAQSQSQAQGYTAQSIPQAAYSQAPQYFSSEALKQLNAGVTYSQ